MPRALAERRSEIWGGKIPFIGSSGFVSGQPKRSKLSRCCSVKKQKCTKRFLKQWQGEVWGLRRELLTRVPHGEPFPSKNSLCFTSKWTGWHKSPSQGRWHNVKFQPLWLTNQFSSSHMDPNGKSSSTQSKFGQELPISGGKDGI